MATELKYPIGIQSFEKLRSQGYAYIDKTSLIYELVHKSNCVFLSRPRRFGKSLLMSTIECYFRGRRDLFEGLAITDLEHDWAEHPVFHFDFNTGSFLEADGLLSLLNNQLANYEKLYGRNPNSDTLQDRFGWLLQRAYEATGKQCVVLIDEYDKPILSAEDAEADSHFRSVLKPFYGNLKSQDHYIRFAMLTGVTRFAKLSIFSDLNNLEDITLDKRFSEICGITEEEMLRYFNKSICELAAAQNISEAQMIEKLRLKYDGYRFSAAEKLVYNPFSLLNSFKKMELKDFWFETGTPSFLVRKLKESDSELFDLERWDVMESTLVDAENNDPISILYQSGYLTIKGYDEDSEMYTLGFPNKEVEKGFLYYLLPTYSGIEKSKTGSTILKPDA